LSKERPVELPSQPILVTGAHRSGTTWVGRMLAASGQIAYVSEPLNVLHRPGVMRAPVRHWYTYICADNEGKYLLALQETLSLQYHLGRELASLRSGKDGLRLVRDGGIFLKGRMLRQRVLLKDPFAVFSASWFAERLGCRVVIVVRNPAAFVSSLLRLGWPFDLQDLLQQPLLMRDWLEPYREELEKSLREKDGLVEQASLLWKLIYSSVECMSLADLAMIVVRHEDLSMNPVDCYRRLYQDLGLEFDARANQAVLRSSEQGNPKQVSRRARHATRLDSRANLENWKLRMDPENVRLVHAITGEVAAQFYSPDELAGYGLNGS
jgi:hypothetical protein